MTILLKLYLLICFCPLPFSFLFVGGWVQKEFAGFVV
jgi:hypothetical protein